MVHNGHEKICSLAPGGFKPPNPTLVSAAVDYTQLQLNMFRLGDGPLQYEHWLSHSHRIIHVAMTTLMQYLISLGLWYSWWVWPGLMPHVNSWSYQGASPTCTILWTLVMCIQRFVLRGRILSQPATGHGTLVPLCWEHSSSSVGHTFRTSVMMLQGNKLHHTTQWHINSEI